MSSRQTAAHGSGGRSPLVTGNEDEFLRELAPGDLLLFDSSYRTSALIKFADNSPVNHCALFTGGSDIVDVTHREGGGGAVQASDLLDRLEKGNDYSVTALHHVSVSRERKEGADRAAEKAKEFCRHDAVYNYRNLVALTLPAFVRVYFPNLDPYSRRAAGLETLANAFISLVEDGADDSSSNRERAEEDWGTLGDPEEDWGTLGDAEEDWGTLGDAEDEVPAKPRLTCSEFVFRCFTDLDVPYGVDLDEPLARYQPPLRQHRRPRSGDELTNQEEQDDQEAELDIAFHPVFAALGDSRTGAPSLTDSRVFRGDPSLNRELMWEAVKVMRAIASSRRRRQQRAWAPQPGQVVAPLVTPRDLWSSPSFVTHAVLVCFRQPGQGAALPAPLAARD